MPSHDTALENWSGRLIQRLFLQWFSIWFFLLGTSGSKCMLFIPGNHKWRKHLARLLCIMISHSQNVPHVHRNTVCEGGWHRAPGLLSVYLKCALANECRTTRFRRQKDFLNILVPLHANTRLLYNILSQVGLWVFSPSILHMYVKYLISSKNPVKHSTVVLECNRSNSEFPDCAERSPAGQSLLSSSSPFSNPTKRFSLHTPRFLSVSTRRFPSKAVPSRDRCN